MSTTSKEKPTTMALQHHTASVPTVQLPLSNDQLEFVDWLDERDSRARRGDRFCMMLLIMILIMHLFWQDMLLENTRTTVGQLKSIRWKLDKMDWL